MRGRKVARVLRAHRRASIKRALVPCRLGGAFMPGRLQTLLRDFRAPVHRKQAFRLLTELHQANLPLEKVVERAIRLGSNGWYRVRSLQVLSEITALAREVEALRPQVILEIGTARGGTALIWAYLAQKRLITCDLLDKRGFADLVRAFPPPGSACEVSVLIGDSHASEFAETVKRTLDGDPVDFLFIDGDHTEEGVAQDYAMYAPLVRPGGLVAFHDIVDHQPLATNQVHHFWKKVRVGADVKEIVDNPNQCGFGIGVLRVPA
ncbi:MAG: class I SAM-dependent methyltransferase [Rhodospirillales bacterium]|nr:MAG: class I SAM-dependent methyltransferase [Rhodospirillales bacterium]